MQSTAKTQDAPTLAHSPTIPRPTLVVPLAVNALPKLLAQPLYQVGHGFTCEPDKSGWRTLGKSILVSPVHTPPL